ncbi:MAG TPA: HlyD family efflux transporter periplasmic adaptor subunit [Candidatus Methylomirabilis sp.]|nr:HlyD family efflux transporter periplasmic adaptor subunit [Candidatus Methylomirabilis sp.]
MRRMLKRARVFLVLAAAAGLIALALRPRPVEVDLAPVARGPLVVTIDEEGETRVRDRFEIAAPVAGELLRVAVEPGDPVVAEHTVLAVIRPSLPAPLDARALAEASGAVRAAEAAVARQQAERERAEAILIRSRQQRDRARSLFEDQAIARDEVDAREMDVRAGEEALRATEFGVAQAQHDLEVARARLIQRRSRDTERDVILRAPVDGVVLRRLRQSQSVVPAGERLLEIGDPRRLEIVSDLLSSDAVKVKPGDAVLIEQWGGGRTLNGRVRRVEPAGFTKVSALGVEEQRVNVVIDFQDPHEAWRSLGDGYRVEIRVVTWQGEGVLKVPTASLFRRGEQWALFVAEDGRARLRTVAIGARNGTEAQVLSGIGERERVVRFPPDTLRDGHRITERPA